VTARATVRSPLGGGRYYTFAGIDRVRELLALPRFYPTDTQVRFRPDGIQVRKPIGGDGTAKPIR
jgi:hypothetical protein